MAKKRKYPPSRSIFVDVDGTLHVKGVLNEKLVDWCKLKKEDGFELVLWSARGESYAREFAEYFKISEVFDKVIGKPGYIVDDLGWSWTKYTGVIDLDAFF